MTSVDELNAAKVRITCLIEEAATREQALYKRLENLWIVLITSVAVGAFVLGGLILHVSGDFFRFEDITRQIAELKIEMSAYHHDQFHKGNDNANSSK